MSRGGSRPGAGRPRKDTVVLYGRVKPATLAKIKARAEERGLTIGQVVDKMRLSR